MTSSTGFNAGNIRDILEDFRQGGIIFDGGKNGDGGGVTGTAHGFSAIDLTFSANENPAIATRQTAVVLLHEILHWAGLQSGGGKYTDAAMAAAWNKLGVVISADEYRRRYPEIVSALTKRDGYDYVESRLAGAANKITCLGATPAVRTLK